jgi:hypothetical protein
VTVTNPNTWSSSWSVDPNGSTSPTIAPANQALNIPITGITGGNWLVATVGWGAFPQVPSTMCVSDDAANYWVPVVVSPTDPTQDSFAVNGNPNFATGASSPWTLAAGSALSVQSAVTHVPQGYAARVTPNGSSATAGITSNKASVQARAGGTVSASAYGYFTQAVTTAFSLVISFYDAGGSLISSVTGAAQSAAANTWTPTTNTTTAPSGAVTASITVQLTGTPAASNVFYVSEAKLYLPEAINYNPFFTNNPALDGWTVSNASAAAVTNVAFNGQPAIEITPAGTASNVTLLASSGNRSPVTGSSFYTASGWLFAPQGYSQTAVEINWYTAGGSLISTSVGNPTAVTPNGWSNANVTAQAPTGAALAAAGFVLNNHPQAWDTVYVAQMTLRSGQGLSSVARCAIWAAPNVSSATTQVFVQPLGDVNGVSASVLQFAGMPSWLTVDDAVASYCVGSSVTSLAATPTQSSLVISTAALNVATQYTLDRVSLNGWQQRASAASTNGLFSSSASFNVTTWQVTGAALTESFYSAAPLNANPVFATDVSGWTATNVTAASSSAFTWPTNSLDPLLVSTKSAKLTPNGSSVSNNFGVTSTSGADALSNFRYLAEFYLYSPTGWSNYQVQLRFYDSGHTLISSVTSASFAVPANTWTNNYVAAAAPNAAFTVTPVLLQNGTPPTSAVTYVGRGTVNIVNELSPVGIAQATAAFQLTPATPAVINPNWPNVRLEAGFGQPSSTPPDQIQWTDISNRLLSVNLQRGRQYELNSLQAGVANFVLRNDDGYLTPKNAQSPYECDVYNPIRLTAVNNGKVFGIFTGFMERWPQVWTDPHWGEVNAVAVDCWALFSKTLQTMPQEEILADQPFGYWPCNDNSMSSIAINIGSEATKTPLQTAGIIGNDPTAFYGTFGDASLGYGGTDYVFNPHSSTLNTSIGQTLVYGPIREITIPPDLPPISNGVTVMMFTGLGSPSHGHSSQVSSQLTLFTALGKSQPIIEVYLAASTHDLYVKTWNANTGATTTWGPVTGPWDTLRDATAGTSNDLPFFLQIASDGFTIYALDPFNFVLTQNGIDTLETTWNTFEAIGRIDAYNADGGFGFVAVNNIAVFDRFLPATRMRTIIASRYGAINDYGDWRVCRYLSYFQPVPARVYYDVRSSQTQLVGSYNQQGQNVGSAINEVVTSEAAFNYIDRNGYFVYRARQNATDRGIQAVLGENTAAGEIPYLVSIELDYDPSQIFNDVQVTYDGASNAQKTATLNGTLVTFADQPSTRQYGDRSLSVNQQVIDFDQTNNLGNYLVNQYRQPSLRVAQVTTTPMSNPTSFSTLLGLDIGDRITVNRRPVGAPAISINVMIIGVSHDIEYASGTWTIKFDIMPQSVAALQTITFTLDTAQLDLLDDGNVIGW